MRRLLLSLLGVLVSIASVNAGKLTAQQALQKAQQFLGGKSVVAVESNKALTRSLGDAPAFYIFNAKDNEGFVIVSADDRTEAVLGYSFHGTFSLDDMPDNIRWWLSEYTKQIKSLTDDYRPSEKATTRADKSAILPLITTAWNQIEPYNLQCPEYGGQKCLTGCTATALAQVLYYYKWPASCISLPAYVTNTLKLSVPELPSTTFKWNQMKATYAYGENSGPAAEAVAELLRYCGQANEMDYTPSGSGAYIHEDVMINSFNYSKNMRRIFRDDFAQDHWESIIYNELAENRPVLYGGDADPGSIGEGHQFICDGYDGNGKYHMNWGWGGHCDGYYLLSACNPESQGVPMGGRYNTGQHANIGFKPAVEGEVIIPDLQSAIQDYSSQSFTRTSGKSDFENIPLYAWIFAVYKVSPESPFNSEVGWGLYQGENLIQTFSAGSVDFEAKNYAYARNKLSVSFGKDLKDGKYQFRQIYKDQITQDWTLCSRYISNSLIVEIAGTSMTVRMIDNGKVKFSVGNLRCSDMPAVGMPVTVTADVTNLGEANYLTACLWSQKEGETTWHNESTRSVTVDQEKTAGIEFQFTPESAGNYNLKITSNVSEDALATAKIEVSAVENVTQDGVSYSCMQAYHTAKIMSADRESAPEELTIPSTVKTSDGTECKVLSIERSAFVNNSKIKKLIISEGVKTIGQDAFTYCYNLEWLVLPSSLAAIGGAAFSYCNSLKIILSKVKTPFEIDENVFANERYENGNWILLPSTATLYVPVGASSVYKKTKGWSDFLKIEEGEPFETVVGDLKYFCSSGSKTATVIQGDYSELESVDIPATISVDKVKYKVKAIGDNAFSSCWNLKTLTLAEGIESIGNSSFQSIGVSELSLPSTLKSIGDGAFEYIYIKSLVIPEGVESIGNYAFYGSGFEKVELPSTLTNLGQYAFASTRSLVIVISRSVNPATVDENTFTSSARWDSESGETIYEPTAATLYIPVGSKSAYQSKGWSAFAKIEEGEPFETVIGGLKYLCSPGSKTATVIQGDYSELESVDIPATISVDKVKYKVKAIGDNAFSFCWNLKTLTLAEGIESIGNRSFQSIGVSELSLPSTLKSIGDDAFEFMYNIKSLVIPEGVESIGNYAFSSSGFEKVELPSTLTNLGQCAFAFTRSLVTVISRSVNPATVDESTFASNSRWDSESGKDIYEPTAATLYIPIGSKSAYQDKGWSVFSKIEEGEPFETVAGGLKYSCSPGSKTAMVIPGDYSELESVKIPATISVDKVKYKVKAIGDNAFSSCWNLKALTLAEGIESIGNSSFQSIGVSELSLPSTLKSIGDDAFGNIYNIKSLVIPEGVESIGNYAFDGSRFEKVELPSTLTSIGDFVFAWCNNLTSVTSYSTSPRNVNTNAFMIEKYDEDLQEWILEPLSAILYVPVGTKKKYMQADGWKEFKNIVEVGEAVSITISAAQQLAYYSDKALDFTLYPELKAYVATGYAKSGTIWLTRVKKVPAETGFLLMGDEGDYEIPVSESASDCYYKNLFKGTLEGATIQTTEDGYTNYYLSKGDYGVSFYKVGASGVKLGTNRAYLSVPSDIPAVGTAGGTETIKVSAALQVPYYSANSLDFTDMESKGLKVYTATGYDYAKGTIWLSRVKQVPAETGILIMADKAGDYDVPKASVASVYENMFMGTLGGKTIQTEETIEGEDYINYYLSKGDYGISFYKVGASGVTLGENRCYLPIPVRESSASGTRSFSSAADQITIQESDEVIGIPLYRGIESDEDGTTSIKDLNPVLSEGEGEWYTLHGQRVAKPGKGLYIKNGKVVVIK